MGVDWVKVLQWEIHSRSELPSPLQSAWCKLNEVSFPPPNPSHFPSAERACAGGWQQYNQFAIHHWPYFNFVWKWHWLLTPTLEIRPRRNIWNGQSPNRVRLGFSKTDQLKKIRIKEMKMSYCSFLYCPNNVYVITICLNCFICSSKTTVLGPFSRQMVQVRVSLLRQNVIRDDCDKGFVLEPATESRRKY